MVELKPPPSLVVTPHAVTLEGQRIIAAELMPGETLGWFLARAVPEYGADAWEVRINGVVVPHEVMDRVRPKDGTVIEVRGKVGRAALMIVAMVALTYFTMGAGAGWIAGTFGVAAGGLAASVIGAGLFMAGSMLINKFLGPKQPKARSQSNDSVLGIGGARNQIRQYEAVSILFGRVRITPDLASMPYTWYEGEDQILGLTLLSGINVHRIEQIYNGDTPLSDYSGVQVNHAGYSGMADQDIPLFSNADTIDGAVLPDTGAWVVRTTSAKTKRIQINLEYTLGGTGTSGKDYNVTETVISEYRVFGATNWVPLVTRTFMAKEIKPRRATLAADVELGQYEVRVRMAGTGNYTGGNTQYNDFAWTTLVSVQADEASYAGLARTGIRIKATDQLNGTPDELRAVGVSTPVPVWKGSAWVTEETSNPGAHILAYARGIKDEDGRLIAGLGWPDEMIDVDGLKGFMLHCAANSYEYNFYVKDVRSCDEQLQAFAAVGFGKVSSAAGKLSVVWAADGQPRSFVANMATIKKGQFEVGYTLINAADGIEYTYYDAETWESKTLRVMAPGVSIMLNPAQVQGEGVTSELHASQLARYHLAQHLYQYKDISYATDLEHLSMRMGSVGSISHDLTQWGYSGRIMAAELTGGGVVLQLDEPVPAPTSGQSWIGLRIPGERTYRTFRVVAFAGESSVLSLADEWPDGVPLPGAAAANPAHDTVWCYDFKATPGYRVRVVSIEPESDLKGATVRVVPEGPEFWDYVLNGGYTPAPNQSLLQTRPVASNLVVTERQVVQGDTVYPELSAAFDVAGPVDYVQVSVKDSNGLDVVELETRLRSASWRIPGADTYTVSIIPYGNGRAGQPATASFTTGTADVPPVGVDRFGVTELAGGLRRYGWAFDEDTAVPADLAGVEVRYIAGTVTDPVWADMTPVADGYQTSAFESALPVSGNWTFACRSRNTSGTLSVEAFVLSKTLAGNLGQIIEALDPESSVERLVELELELAQEKVDRFNADAQEALDRAGSIASEALALQAEIDAERIARESDVAAARLRIDAIDDDEIISPVEKPQLRIDFQSLIDERPGIVAQAALSEAITELNAYQAAVYALETYMATLTLPVRWDDTSSHTNLK